MNCSSIYSAWLSTGLIHPLSVWFTLVTLLSDCRPVANALSASQFYWALFALSCLATADCKSDWLSSKVPVNFTCLVWWISFWVWVLPYRITDRWIQLHSCCALKPFVEQLVYTKEWLWFKAAWDPALWIKWSSISYHNVFHKHVLAQKTQTILKTLRKIT